tara:strand:+ start:13740 stop:14207 length:468 start_codon:yes stop_codon:yes gene_type:complete
MVINHDNYTMTAPYAGEDFLDIPLTALPWRVEVIGYSSNMQGGDKVCCCVLTGVLAGYTIYMAGDEFIKVLKSGAFDPATNILFFNGKMKKHGSNWRLRPEVPETGATLRGWYIAQCAELTAMLKVVPENDVFVRPGLKARLEMFRTKLEQTKRN